MKGVKVTIINGLCSSCGREYIDPDSPVPNGTCPAEDCPSNSPIQILTEVRDLFQDRSKWTRGVHARNRNHVPVEPWNRHAVCWCLDGALALKAGMKDWSETTNVYDELSDLFRVQFSSSIVDINDDEGYKAVLQLLDKAIAHVQN